MVLFLSMSHCRDNGWWWNGSLFSPHLCGKNFVSTVWTLFFFFPPLPMSLVTTGHVMNFNWNLSWQMQAETASPEQPVCLRFVLSRSFPEGMHTCCRYLMLMRHLKTCLEADWMHIMVCHVSVFSEQPATGNVHLYRNICALLFLWSSCLGEFCHTF